jgi:Uma2 family endonuclease
MSASTTVSLEEYLATSYRPDQDYVEGLLFERNVGQKDHSRLQRRVLEWFGRRSRKLNIEAFPEQRIRVASQRFRVPDVCIVQLPEPDEQVFTRPPYICIEILSPEDTFPRLQERFDDYLEMGVPNIWVFDPASRRGWWITREGHWEALDGVLRTRDAVVALPIADLFAAVDNDA